MKISFSRGALRQLSRFWQRWGLAALLFGMLLAALEWLVPALGVPAFILPPPSHVWRELLNPESRIAYHSAITAFEALSGFALGSLLGFALAVAFVALPVLERALYPWVLVSQTIPLVALAPLLVFWLGPGLAPRIALAALFAFFPVLVAALRGLRDVDSDHEALLRVFGASPWRSFCEVRWPACLPALFAGLRIAAALAVIGAITAELAGARAGLGFAVTIAGSRLETARVFAAVVAAAALGMSLHLSLSALERRIVFWK